MRVTGSRNAPFFKIKRGPSNANPNPNANNNSGAQTETHNTSNSQAAPKKPQKFDLEKPFETYIQEESSGEASKSPKQKQPVNPNIIQLPQEQTKVWEKFREDRRDGMPLDLQAKPLEVTVNPPRGETNVSWQRYTKAWRAVDKKKETEVTADPQRGKTKAWWKQWGGVDKKEGTGKGKNLESASEPEAAKAESSLHSQVAPEVMESFQTARKELLEALHNLKAQVPESHPNNLETEQGTSKPSNNNSGALEKKSNESKAESSHMAGKIIATKQASNDGKLSVTTINARAIRPTRVAGEVDGIVRGISPYRDKIVSINNKKNELVDKIMEYEKRNPSKDIHLKDPMSPTIPSIKQEIEKLEYELHAHKGLEDRWVEQKKAEFNRQGGSGGNILSDLTEHILLNEKSVLLTKSGNKTQKKEDIEAWKRFRENLIQADPDTQEGKFMLECGTFADRLLHDKNPFTPKKAEGYKAHPGEVEMMKRFPYVAGDLRDGAIGIKARQENDKLVYEKVVYPAGSKTNLDLVPSQGENIIVHALPHKKGEDFVPDREMLKQAVRNYGSDYADTYYVLPRHEDSYKSGKGLELYRVLPYPEYGQIHFPSDRDIEAKESGPQR